jgi:hypothetical protein
LPTHFDPFEPRYTQQKRRERDSAPLPIREDTDDDEYFDHVDMVPETQQVEQVEQHEQVEQDEEVQEVEEFVGFKVFNFNRTLVILCFLIILYNVYLILIKF